MQAMLVSVYCWVRSYLFHFVWFQIKLISFSFSTNQEFIFPTIHKDKANDARLSDEKLYIRHCIRYEFQQGKTIAQAYEMICATLGKDAVSHTTCKYWFNRFKDGNFDVTELGEPSVHTNGNGVHTDDDIVERPGIQQQAAAKSLRKIGKAQKVVQFVPHDLSDYSIGQRLNTCVSLLARQQKQDYLWKIVTGDETWIMYDHSNAGPASTLTGAPDNSGKKVLLWIWWDMKGILCYDLLEPEETDTEKRYEQQLNRLAEELDRKRPFTGRGPRDVILLHNNSQAHVSVATQATILNLGWEVIAHAAYSPDLAPCDYHLFQSIQSGLADQRFRDVDDIRKWLDEFVVSKPSSFFREGIRQLPERWQKVIENGGEYSDDWTFVKYYSMNKVWFFFKEKNFDCIYCYKLMGLKMVLYFEFIIHNILRIKCGLCIINTNDPTSLYPSHTDTHLFCRLLYIILN